MGLRPAVVTRSMLQKKHLVITMLAFRKGSLDVSLQMGRLRTLNTPPSPAFKAIHAYGKNSCHHHGSSRGRLCGSFCSKGPPFLKTTMLMVKHHVIAMFTVRECTGGLCALIPLMPLLFARSFFLVSSRMHFLVLSLTVMITLVTITTSIISSFLRAPWRGAFDIF